MLTSWLSIQFYCRDKIKCCCIWCAIFLFNIYLKSPDSRTYFLNACNSFKLMIIQWGLSIFCEIPMHTHWWPCIPGYSMIIELWEGVLKLILHSVDWGGSRYNEDWYRTWAPTVWYTHRYTRWTGSHLSVQKRSRRGGHIKAILSR